MSRLDRLSADVERPVAPDFERALRVGNSGRAPNNQQRAGNLVSLPIIEFISGKIDRAAGSIVLTGRTDSLWLRKERPIVMERALIKRRQVFRLGPAGHDP